jgi:uncharacterized protein
MSEMIRVEVVSAFAQEVKRVTLSVTAGSTVQSVLETLDFAADAQAASAALAETAHLADSYVGIWGRRVALNTTLNDGDRIELYRAVIADAKTARLKRASEQGYRWQGRTRRAAYK